MEEVKIEYHDDYIRIIKEPNSITLSFDEAIDISNKIANFIYDEEWS